MTPHELLLKSIRERQDKLTEFNQGILTADRYVKTISECVGSDLCYRFAAKGNISFQDIITKAANVLTYNNEDMHIEDIYGKDYQWRNKDGDSLELPKNTLMVFKHVLTTPRKDRDGDIMRTQGAKLDPKMLLLWQHVHTLPIGKLLQSVEHNSKKLTVISAIVDMNELSHDAAVMVDNKMGRFSHGFKAIEFDKNKDGGGFDVKSFEIMEESLVSIPSNVDADTEEVLLSLVEGGKLTSVMMKNVGKSIREKMPKQFAGGIGHLPLSIDVNLTLNGKSINGNGTTAILESTAETKCSGGADCGCGCGGAGSSGASKETDDDDGGEKDANDKEMMMCPQCGARMVNGKCTKCGYIMEKSAGDVSLNGSGKSHAASLISSDNVTKSGSWSGPSADAENSYIKENGIEAFAKWHLGKRAGSDAKTKEAWAYPFTNDFENVDRAGLIAIRQRAGQQNATSIFNAAGELLKKIDGNSGGGKDVEIPTGDMNDSDLQEKAGRRISAANMEHLQSAHDSVQEVHQNEHLMSKGSRALCEKAMGHIKSVMGSGMHDLGETSTEPKEKTISEFLATADRNERQQMRKKLDTLDDVENMRRLTKAFKHLSK